jgi:hypothetical protein
MSTENCNGWSNSETWNINLRFEQIFKYMANVNNYKSLEAMAEAFENVVFELEFDNLEASDFVREIVDEYLNRVDFEEIAKHFFEEEKEETEEV